MKGVNDHELHDFVNFSAEQDIEVRFLEVMKIGQACSQDDLFISAGEAIHELESKLRLQPVRVEKDSTSFNYETENGAQVGFIASESLPFCGNCSRWRLTADGYLRACLMSTDGIKIRGVRPDEYDSILQQLLPMKPKGRIHHIEQDMNQIGG